MKKKGFSLVETQIALGLSLLVLLAAFEFLGLTRSLFFKLKEAQEKNQAIQAALVKLRIDLLRAGFGLEVPLRVGVIEGIDVSGSTLDILSLDGAFALIADASPGEERISLDSVTGLSPGRRVCLADAEKAELHTIDALEVNTVVLSEPLEASYLGTAAQLLLLEEVGYFLDEKSGVLRRKVNASPAQPLLDETGLFVPVYQREANLVSLRLAGKANQEKTFPPAGLRLRKRDQGRTPLSCLGRREVSSAGRHHRGEICRTEGRHPELRKPSGRGSDGPSLPDSVPVAGRRDDLEEPHRLSIPKRCRTRRIYPGPVHPSCPV
jgi:hypothetical protein